MLKQKEIENLVKKIVDRIEPEKVIIFGSYAKDTATNKSDLVIFIIKDTQLPFKLRTQELGSLFLNPIVDVDIHVYTPEEVEVYGEEAFSFVSCVLRTGRCYFSRNSN